MNIEEFKKDSMTNFKPLSKNICMEATTKGPLEEALNNFYVRFNDDFKDVEELEKILSIIKLYMRIIFKDAPKEMIIQSNLLLNELIDMNNYEEKFYCFVGEIRKIELIDRKTKKILLIIKREKVFIPKEFNSTERIKLLEGANE